MIEKIELYREVLAIEPNSKAFFPLARALSETGREAEAIAVLEKGIGFHPDHLEAKFFLVELLSRQDREDEALKVFSGVGDSLVRYPAVWRLWSRHAAFTSRDPVLALAFLAQYFRDPGLTFAGVLEKGLEVLAGLPAAVRTEPARLESPAASGGRAGEIVSEERTSPDPSPAQASPGEDVSAEAEDMTAFSPPVSEPDMAHDAGDEPPLRGASEVLELAGLLGMGDAAEDGGTSEVAPASGMPVPGSAARTAALPDMGIRTATMAQLLADQGDARGALDIYEELAARLPVGPERDGVLTRMAELSAAAPGTPAPRTAAKTPEPAPGPQKAKGKARLMGLLDALAGRLEARAGA